MATALSVNLNAIALLRNRRDLPWPNVLHFARIALNAGAAGITLHPRPDQRHAKPSDVLAIRQLIRNEFPGRELNIEGYPTDDFIALCLRAEADQVTLVPDDPTQSTSDHGWAVVAHAELLSQTIAALKPGQPRISLFVDHDATRSELETAASLGAERIEIYTGPYGGCYDNPTKEAEVLAILGQTADTALEIGLEINAGHDLTLDNLPRLIGRVPALAEVSIGHQLIADAMEFGLAQTVHRFKAACSASAL